MKFISHRGNIDKISIQEENNPNKILYCLSLGYDVEVDVWYINKDFYLGHDKPQFKINIDFLKNKNLWCHAKNLNSLQKMIENNIHCFWHQNDDYALTSSGILWAYPGKVIQYNVVAVLPEKTNYLVEDLKNCYGICSDKISFYKELMINE